MRDRQTEPAGVETWRCYVAGLEDGWGGSEVKNLPANAGHTGDTSSIPESRRSPRGGNGNLLQYSCLENPMDREACQATVRLQPLWGSKESDKTVYTDTHTHTQEAMWDEEQRQPLNTWICKGKDSFQILQKEGDSADILILTPWKPISGTASRTIRQ